MAAKATTAKPDIGDTNVEQSPDEQVLAAAKNYCEAQVDATTKKSLVFTVGKTGPSQKQVAYSADKNFAYVNGGCDVDAGTPGTSSAYYLKKVNNTWVFLYNGTQADPVKTKLFGIPSSFS